jgi:hypothetical protein
MLTPEARDRLLEAIKYASSLDRSYDTFEVDDIATLLAALETAERECVFCKSMCRCGCHVSPDGESPSSGETRRGEGKARAQYHNLFRNPGEDYEDV